MVKATDSTSDITDEEFPVYNSPAQMFKITIQSFVPNFCKAAADTQTGINMGVEDQGLSNDSSLSDNPHMEPREF